MSSVFAFQLGLKIHKTSIGAQKTDDIIVNTNQIIVSTFSMLNKDDRVRFFKNNLLLTNVKRDIVIEIFFLTMSNVNINFQS